MPIYQFKCHECGEEKEVLQKISDPNPVCEYGHGEMSKEFNTPAFTFKNGKGTSGGHTMRIASKKK